MFKQISVPMPTDVFLQLAKFLEEKGDVRDPVSAVADAVEYWMQNADWKPELLQVPSSDGRGFQWKSVFMPSGTEVRMPYRGDWYYARVEGDQLIYEGAATTPGRLANTITQTSRNAWRDLWIKRPGDSTWHLADSLRAGAGED